MNRNFDCGYILSIPAIHCAIPACLSWPYLGGHLIWPKVLLVAFSQEVYPPAWLIPLISVTGIIMLPLILHLAKFIGKVHGKFAKFMLVRKLEEINHV